MHAGDVWVSRVGGEDLAELNQLYRALEQKQKLRGAELFGSLMAQDEELVRKGFPPMTDWWRDTMRDFYLSGKRRFVGRVGRKGTKSASLCRVAVNEVRHGAHPLRPGDLGLFMFISENMKEATGRIFTIKAILDALGEAYEPLGPDLRLKGRPLLFGVRAGRIGAVSGPVVIGFVGDEVAKWRDEDTGANPATEVLRSVRPATVTQPNAHEFLISSPWSDLDAHAEAFDEGNTDGQMVAWAPTWIANPTVTEAETKALEPDAPTWTREYKAEPMGSGTQHWFDSAMIKEACKGGLVLPVYKEPGSVISAGGDFAFVSDRAALCVSHRFGDWEKARHRIAGLYELAPTTGPLKPGFVCKEFAARLKAHGCSSVMADGHYKMSIVEHLDEERLAFRDAPTEVSGPYVRTRVLLNGVRLDLPADDSLIGQMKSVMWRPTPSGGISIILPRKAGSGHCDKVSALVLSVSQPNGDEVPAEVQQDDQERMRLAVQERWNQRQQDKEEGTDWLQNRFSR